MSQPPHPADPPRAARTTVLLIIYTLLYTTFILLTIRTPEIMAQDAIPLGKYEIGLHGANLAIIYGLALILGAIPLAFLALPSPTQTPPTPKP